MSRTKMMAYNSGITALFQIVTLVIGLILPRLYLVTYGSEINGLVSSVQQFISVFKYVEAGLGASLIYLLFKPLANKEFYIVNSIVAQAKNLYKKTSAIYFLLVVCLSIIYPYIIDSQNINSFTIVALILVVGLLGALDFYTIAKYRVLLTADQKIYIFSLISVVILVINFVFTYFLISIKSNIVLVQAIPIITFFIRYLALKLYVDRNYAYIDYRDASYKTKINTRYDALIMQLSISLNLSIPIIVISIFCTLKVVSVFAIYNMVFLGLMGIVSVFSTGATSSFGNIIAKKEFDILKKTNDEFEFLLYMVITFLFSSTLILIIPFVEVYTQGITDINYINPTYGLLFVIWGVLHNIRIPHTSLINASGLYKETRKVNVLQVIILLVLSLILVQFWGVTGVLIALIVTALYRSIDLIILIRKLVLKSSPKSTFLRISRIFIVIFFSYIPFVIWIDISPKSLFEWLFWALGASVWCALTTLISNLIFEKMVLLATIKRFWNLLRRLT